MTERAQPLCTLARTPARDSKTPNGRTISEEQWKNHAHELVFDALERSVGGLKWPARKEDVVENAKDARVLEEPRMRLEAFLKTLPDREFANKEEVSRALNDTSMSADEAPTTPRDRMP